MQTPAMPTNRSALGRLRPPCGLVPPAMTAVLLALALAGCGGSSSPGVAHIGTTSAANAPSTSNGGTSEVGENSPALQREMVKFSQCMRTHGEPQFPEPVEGHITLNNHNGSGPNPESPQFQAAEKACHQYAPTPKAPSPEQQAKMQEQALKFSECMRQHGVPNFPDPKFSGGGTRVSLKLGKSSGIEPGSPQFQAAQRACQSVSPLGKLGKGAAPAGKASGTEGSGAQSGGETAVAP
jgi:hypothetical protein